MFYFGHCAGGVWQTSDGGRFWTSISDGYFATGAVGALAISESDPNVLYAGMGETNIRGNVSHGDGVYRSTDGGRSWQNVGLRQTRHIARIRIDPRDPDIAYVAAFGHVYGPNPERGVYRTLDGGKNWDRILFRDDRTAAIDLSIDVTNPRILYAALWEGCVRHTVSPAEVRVVAFSAPATGATPGLSSPATRVSRRDCGVGRAWPFPRPIQIACGRSSKPKRMEAAYSAPTIAARRGCAPPPKRASRSARGISCTSLLILGMLRPSGA